MNLLDIPEVFKGAWNNALILTYGVNVPFFENAIRPQFRTLCRNIVILADGNQYLDVSKDYAENQIVRHLNHKYIVDGIFKRTFHPKAILLTMSEKGLLLIGSGNLGLRGYASGGEMFTRYEYAPDETGHLPTFNYFREFIQGLINDRALSPRTVDHINLLFESTPWLFGSVRAKDCYIRHNLNTSFLQQLQEMIKEDPVRDLWVLSPFYDERADALEVIIDTLRPEHVRLLIQPGCTSIDPSAIKRIMELHPGVLELRPFHLPAEDTYVHNKLYVFTLDDRTVCLQGSPNLSQSAMSRTHPTGNIEIANLLVGSPGSFSALFDALEIQPPVSDLESLDVSFKSDQTDTEPDINLILTGGELKGQNLRLFFQNPVEYLDVHGLKIGSTVFLPSIKSQSPTNVLMVLPSDASTLLDSALAVRLLWTIDGSSFESNPIFICNIAALEAILASDEGTGISIDEVGDLDLEDEEFEQLLGKLNAALVIDRRSIWQLAGKTPPRVETTEEDELRLSYAEINYERLRQHPRIKQYQEGRTVVTIDRQFYQPSRLQLILNSINSHFKNLEDRTNEIGAEEIPIIPEDEAQDLAEQEDTEEEIEEREEEKERRRRSWLTRIRRILKGFIRRYLRGLKSVDFLELAGWDVVAKNYVIFSHILWRLFTKEWLEDKFIIESFLKIWLFFWGDERKPGYFSQLDEDIRLLVINLLRENNTDAQLIAALYYCNYLSKFHQWHELRFGLRDFLRNFIQRSHFHVDTEKIEEAWIFLGSIFPYNPPLPSTIFNDLLELGRFENSESFLRSLELKMGLKKNACHFEQPRPGMIRPNAYRSTSIDSLVIRTLDALPNIETAVEIYQFWMRHSPIVFCRIVNSDSSQRFWYDREANIGLYADIPTNEIIDIGELPDLPLEEWEVHFVQLLELSWEIDESLSIRSNIVIE